MARGGYNAGNRGQGNARGGGPSRPDRAAPPGVIAGKKNPQNNQNFEISNFGSFQN